MMESIIHYYKLEINDIRIVARGFKDYLSKYRNITINIPKEMTSDNYLLEFKNFKACLNKIDSTLNESLGKTEFKLYTPNYSQKFSQILSTHPLCKEINQIEEGVGSYRKYSEMIRFASKQFNWIEKLVNKLKYRNRITFSGFIEPRCSNLYSLSDKAFDSHQKVVNVLSYEVLNEISRKDFNAPILERSNAALLVLDAVVPAGYIEECKYLSIIQQTTSVLLKYNFIYVIFHPYQKERERNLILSIFTNNNIQYEMLNNNFITDLIILKNKSIEMLGFVSSTLIYNVILCQEKSKSFINLYPENIKKKVSDVFLELVETV